MGLTKREFFSSAAVWLNGRNENRYLEIERGKYYFDLILFMYVLHVCLVSNNTCWVAVNVQQNWCWLIPFLRLCWTFQVICALRRVDQVDVKNSALRHYCETCRLCLQTVLMWHILVEALLLVVSAQLCDILSVCLPDMESRCLITHVCLCWEHPAHLSSNELHETDCFFILHLTLQQKCLNKTAPPLTGCLPLQGTRGTNCLNEVFEGGVMIFLR